MKKLILTLIIFVLMSTCLMFVACQEPEEPEFTCICSYETFELEASCGKDGYVIDHCTKCGKILIKEKIPMPDTIFSPMTYANIGYTNMEFLNSVINVVYHIDNAELTR